MGGWFDDWKEDMEDTWLFETAKKAGRAGADVVQYGVVPAAAIFLGPLGAAAAIPVAAAAGQVGPNENRSAQLQRDLISGGIVTAATGGLSLITGGGLSNTLWESFQSLFGFGPTPPAQPGTPTAMNNNDLWAQYVKANSPVPPAAGGSGAGGSPSVDPLAALGKIFNPTAQANPAQLQQQYKDQLALMEKLRAAGDVSGAAQAAALAEIYRRQLAAQGVNTAGVGGGMSPLLLLFLLGGGAWLLLRKKR